MKRTTRTAMLAAGAAALGLAATLAIAHPGGYGMGAGPGAGYGMGPGMMGMGPGAGMGPGMMGMGPGAHMGPGMMGMGRGPGMGPGMMGMGPQAMQGVDFATAFGPRLDAAKAELKITADQETAWQAYVAQAKARFETMQAGMAAMHSAAPATPAERIEQHAAMMKQHAVVAEQTAQAVKALYAALTPEQRALADQRLFAGGPGFGRGPRGVVR